MLFCSYSFLYFFAIIFALYWVTSSHGFRTWLLLIASFTFYATWNTWLATLILATTLVDYLLARGMDAYAGSARKRFLLIVSLVMNLGLLVYFKYANFFLDSLGQALTVFGISASLPVLQVILPIGISFYTFEAINYTVDVYRGKIKAERNLAHFLLFMLFFPHLVAGPIVRAADFLPQVRRRKHWNWRRLQVGIELVLLGMFKKLAIADRMALFADPVFANPELYGTYATWLGVLAYALQVYCDFSGYSDMALGTAHMLGFHLAQNFNLPYMARNITEFWRRWHMSLSSWLRDYLFIPLGGSRGSHWRTSLNVLITMTLCGLWHGASWNYVTFGTLQGLLLIGHRLFKNVVDRLRIIRQALTSLPGHCLCVAFTFLVFMLSLVLFRATSFTLCGRIWYNLFAGVGRLERQALHSTNLWFLLGVVVACHVLVESGCWRRLAQRLPAPVLGFSYAVLLAFTMLLTLESGQAFIYFQF